MKSRIGWVVGGVLAFLIFLIAYLPASQVIGRIDLPRNVAVSGVSGTIWEGKVQTVVANGLPIYDLKWDVNPWTLVMGKVSVTLNAGNFRDAEAIAFEGPVSTSLFNLEHVESDGFLLFLPVDRVLAEVPLPLPVNAGGRFRVRLETLSFGPACESLQGFGDWLNATVAGTQGPIDFGNYTAKLACDGEDITINVEEPNMLGLTMNAVVAPDFNVKGVTGRFKPDDSLPNEVHQASRFFGQPGPEGYIQIDL